MTTRRRFLETSTAACAAAAIRPVWGSEPADEKLNLGIIGCGGIMTHHVKGLVGRKENINISSRA